MDILSIPDEIRGSDSLQSAFLCKKTLISFGILTLKEEFDHMFFIQVIEMFL